MNDKGLSKRLAKCDALAERIEEELRGCKLLVAQHVELMANIQGLNRQIYESLRTWRIYRKELSELIDRNDDSADWWKSGEDPF